MILSVQCYPGSLDAFAPSPNAALRWFDETRDLVGTLAQQRLEVVGPFPIYVLDPDMVVEVATEGGVHRARRVGRRALVAVSASRRRWPKSWSRPMATNS